MAKDTVFENEFEGLLEKIKSYLPNANLQRIRGAFEFAMNAHKGQLRKSGEAYIIHPMKTVEILTNLHVDEDTIVAAILHDVPEDTKRSLKEIKEKFGQKIAYLVDGITKLTKVHYRDDMESRQIESLKKLFIHSAEDLRVILIKLADRLHNMRTLRYIAEEKKRVRIARETLEIYVPIANLLGISELRGALEDLCFEHLYPEEYRKLELTLQEGMEERNFVLDEMIHLAENELKKHNVDAEIIGRQKTLYSTFRKLQAQKTLGSMDDIIAIRVVVGTRKDCYAVLGIIHRLFKPKHGCFKDYIAVPKPNGYQSIHTVVYGIDSMPVEYQIRTQYMHLEAEYGVAAHYFYKYSNEEELTNIMRQRSTWVQKILEIQKENDNKHFLENLKLDVFQDRIFVFTPKGDVIDLPKGACILDFAYAIHTDIGNRTAKGEINGVIYPVTTPLSTGDSVRIITAKQKKPERDWLNYVKTMLAYNKIRQSLSRLPAEERIRLGKQTIQKEFYHLGKNFIYELNPKRIELLSKHFAIRSLDDLLEGIGEGSINPKEILGILYDEPLFRKGKGFFHRVVNLRNRREGFLSKVGMRVTGSNQKGEFKEIFRTLSALKIPVVKFFIDRPWRSLKDRCRLTLLVKNYHELSQVFESLEQLPGIEKITRSFFRRKMIFSFLILVTLALWMSHPFIIHYLASASESVKGKPQLIFSIFAYAGFLMLFGLIYYLKELTSRSFPELHEGKYFWPVLCAMNTLALGTVFAEILLYDFAVNSIFILIFVIFLYAALLKGYINYRKLQI